MRTLLVASVLAAAALAGCTEPGPAAGPAIGEPDGEAARAAGAESMTDPAESRNQTGPGAGSPGTLGGDRPANASAPPGPLPTWGPPDAAELFPGIKDERGCTTNFLFTSLDNRRVFVGSAAHCYVEDSENLTDGSAACDPKTVPFAMGTPVRFIQAGQGNVDWVVEGEPVEYLPINGTLAYSSWQAMLDAGEDIDDPICWKNDFVLIEVPLDAQGSMTPHFRVLGPPTGLASIAEVAVGSDLVSYGHSSSWMEVEQLHPKQGKVTQTVDPDTRPISFVAAFAPPGIEGDSGSAALTAEGKAAGVLSGYAWAHEGEVGTGEYAFLPALLEYMALHTGLAVKLAQP